MLLFRNKVKDTDAEAVRNIVASTGFFETAPDEIDVAVELVEEALVKGCDESGYHFIFAEDAAGRVVSYTCFGPIPCTVSSYDLYWIATHNDCRGKGFGAHVMAKTIEAVKNMGGSKLVLNTSGQDMYKPTQGFYHKCGFELEAILKNYYAKGDDCLIFSMDI